MINWNDLKNLDVKHLDLTKLDLTKLDLTKLDVRKMQMPNFAMPNIDLPELPADADRMIGIARDAAYAGVGMAVVTVQKLDAQRRALTDQVTAKVRDAVDSVA